MATQQNTDQRAKVFDALSDPTRLRIVELLTQSDELSGSEIANRVDISLALFCHHSKTLAEAGIIQVRKEGQTKYHSLNRDLLTTCFASFGLGEGVKE
ncbi:MAG: metalloregulator ArsR/SmtB family transcription factor [Oculatellaceae cyanobacterium bins.114]|nr:metalloregulator ArsR/SmtB family transcription factor [Oculatellaceae cyanobacterium bins.114]